MERQRELVDYWTRTFDLPREQVAHVLLLPEGLKRERPGVRGTVVTWQELADAFTAVGPGYWLSVLREALALYPDLVSKDLNFQANAETMLTGQAVVDRFEAGDLQYEAIGRLGGLHGPRLQADLAEGTWRAQKYQLRTQLDPAKQHWFAVADFVERAQGTVPPVPSVPSAPGSPRRPERVTLHGANHQHVWASQSQDGAVVIEGQDLAERDGVEEYDFALTVRPEHVPALRVALGGGADGDTLELLAQHGAELVQTGESTWLAQHEIVFQLWTRVEHTK